MSSRNLMARLGHPLRSPTGAFNNPTTRIARVVFHASAAEGPEVLSYRM